MTLLESQGCTTIALLPLITAVRLSGVARPALRHAERLVTHDLTLRLVGRLRAGVLSALVPLSPAALWLVGWDVVAGATDPVLLAATALGVLGAFESVGGLGAAPARRSP